MDRRRPDWILLSSVAVAGRNNNAIAGAATGCTRYGETIEVSLSLEHPPHPSILYVHSPDFDMNLCRPTNIVCAAEDLLLVAVNIGRSGLISSHYSRDVVDHFIYQARHHTSRRPSLQRLQRPADDPYFHYRHVGLLPRRSHGGGYTVAALIPTSALQYKLYVLHSHTQSWSCRTLSVEVPPQEPFPVELLRVWTELHRHLTSGVITVGGGEDDDGTIGWVDHWRGILFCDVLLENHPSLRGVPIPLRKMMTSRNASANEEDNDDFAFGPGWERRGIALSRDKPQVLKLVHLEVTATRLPYKDPETGDLSSKVDGWSLTTWSNTRMSMTSSYEDWHQDCTVHASDITIDNPAVSQVIQSGLLAGGMALQNIVMSEPVFQCVNNGKEEGDVICLVARKKHNHPVAWILTVDMKNAKVQAVEEFGTTGRQIDSYYTIYYPSMISQYMMMNPPTNLAGHSLSISSKETTQEEQLHVGMKPSDERPTAPDWFTKLLGLQPDQARRMQYTLDQLAKLGRRRGRFPQPGGDDADRGMK